MFLLFLMVLGTANVNAQVRIGGNAAPNASAVLDLNKTDTTNYGTKTLGLPRVSLASPTDLLGNTTILTGMLVYNTNAGMPMGQGTGVYVWNGSIWSVVGGEAGIAGHVTGTKGTYRTWCYPPSTGLGCWMIDNSREGTPTFVTYPGSATGLLGSYYVQAQASTACPPGYVLPTLAQYNALIAYINSPYSTIREYTQWSDISALQGLATGVPSSVNWQWLGAAGFWWSAETAEGVTQFGGTLAQWYFFPDSYALSVRCVKY